MGKDNWLIRKDGPEPLLAKKKKAYPHWERANTSYSHWLSGKTTDEIAKFTNVAIEEIEKDIAHIESVISSKQLISNNNTRQRLLIQREQGIAYQKKLQDALNVSVADYLRAGLNPTTPLKEYREAVGMTEKPGALSINVQQNNTSISGGVSRTEDVIRNVMKKMEVERQKAMDAEAIDAEFEGVELTEEGEVAQPDYD